MTNPSEQLKIILLLSGGMDSTTALYWAIYEKYTPIALSINYAYRPQQERTAVKELITRSNIQMVEVPLPFVMDVVDLKRGGFPIPTATDAPEGYIPVKNLLFFATAAYYSEVFGACALIGGNLLSDALRFPDASLAYFADIERVLSRVTLPGGCASPRILLPFIKKTKAEVLRWGLEHGVPYEITWSCYDEGIRGKPCEKCAPCRERAAAFNEVGIPDPLLVRIRKGGSDISLINT